MKKHTNILATAMVAVAFVLQGFPADAQTAAH